jgi:hypothetical protein
VLVGSTEQDVTTPVFEQLKYTRAALWVTVKVTVLFELFAGAVVLAVFGVTVTKKRSAELE